METDQYICDKCGYEAELPNQRWSDFHDCPKCQGKMYPLNYKPKKAPIKGIGGGSAYA